MMWRVFVVLLVAVALEQDLQAESALRLGDPTAVDGVWTAPVIARIESGSRLDARGAPSDVFQAMGLKVEFGPSEVVVSAEIARSGGTNDGRTPVWNHTVESSTGALYWAIQFGASGPAIVTVNDTDTVVALVRLVLAPGTNHGAAWARISGDARMTLLSNSGGTRVLSRGEGLAVDEQEGRTQAAKAAAGRRE